MGKSVLQLVKGNSFLSNGIFSAGVYSHDGTTILIDSGSDDASARAIYEAIQSRSDNITAIINTHCHPDHCGGNYFFQRKFPTLRILCARDEREFIENITLSARCFCGGAAPFSGLRNKHIGPQKESSITEIFAAGQEQKLVINNEILTILPLPGHTPGSIGVITPDNILYCGDALFGEEVLKKHPVPFYTNIGDALTSFKRLAQLSVEGCVLYHGGFIDNLAYVAQKHETLILETKDRVLGTLKEGALSIDLITQKMMQAHHIPNTMMAFTLTQTTIRAYLAHLEYEKSIEFIVQDGLLQATLLLY